MSSKRHMLALSVRLRTKAVQTTSNYHIAAAAYSKKGNLLGIATNRINTIYTSSRRGGGVHAERELIARYGRGIRYIVLSRVGGGGEVQPIHPCAVCTKILNKLNIRVVLMHEVLNELDKKEESR